MAPPCPGITLTAEAYLRAIINPGRDFDCNTTLVLLSAGTPALRAGVGDNSALTVALRAGGDIGEATKEALLDSAHLPGAITVGASCWLSSWLGAHTLAQ